MFLWNYLIFGLQQPHHLPAPTKPPNLYTFMPTPSSFDFATFKLLAFHKITLPVECSKLHLFFSDHSYLFPACVILGVAEIQGLGPNKSYMADIMDIVTFESPNTKQ